MSRETDEPDYARYSLADLIDTREHIDRSQFLERARRLDAEIARRLSPDCECGPEAMPGAGGAAASSSDAAQPTEPARPARDGAARGPAVAPVQGRMADGPGRSGSLWQAAAELVGGIVVAWVLWQFTPDGWDERTRRLAVAMVLGTSVLAALVHAYRAVASRRIVSKAVVARKVERDDRYASVFDDGQHRSRDR